MAEIKADDTELIAASGEVDGRALTLNLLGRFLARAPGGDNRVNGIRIGEIPLNVSHRLRLIENSTNGGGADLDKAWDIAERGPMRLHLADIHLHDARLFFREKPYPWKSP